MRALLVDRQLTVRDDYPDPAPAPGESIVRVRMAGICGTDLELARGYMSYRGVPGMRFVPRWPEPPLPQPHRARNRGPRRCLRRVPPAARRKPDCSARFDTRRAWRLCRAGRGNL